MAHLHAHGFIYARKQSTDIFKIGRVKEFGHVWHQKLIELSCENISIRAIARELGVDSKTVKIFRTAIIQTGPAKGSYYSIKLRFI